MQKGFDTNKYIQIQELEILKRADKYDRIYLEVGGHLNYDGHASRVLPGYKPQTKLSLFRDLYEVENISIIYCVNSKDLASKKRLGDFDINYAKQTLKDISSFKKLNLQEIVLVITRYEKKYHKIVSKFIKKMKNKVKKSYIHKEINNYTKSPQHAIKGYKKNEYIKLNSDLVLITGAAGGSGKMATAMSQLYHDLKIRKIKSGYAKFETFPVWNLPLNHPINLAYEAATADLQDKNKIDPYHLRKYKIKAVNYNRDIENFSILIKLSNLITKTNSKSAFGYFSPTDMGIGNTKFGIINEDLCKKAAIKEINRRMKIYTKEFKANRESEQTIKRMNEILKKLK